MPPEIRGDLLIQGFPVLFFLIKSRNVFFGPGKARQVPGGARSSLRWKEGEQWRHCGRAGRVRCPV